MAEWKIPVEWSVCAMFEVSAPTLKEAIEIAKDEKGEIPLPLESSYIDDSWAVSESNIDFIRCLYNDNQPDDGEQEMINSFLGKYYYLSNFYPCAIEYKGITYQNNEAAFQAQKVIKPEDRKMFAKLDPSAAKQLGRRVTLRDDWEAIKDTVMYEVCLAKFSQNQELMDRLLKTGSRHLEEGNTWGDKVWGTVNGEGENRLGKILMRVREELRVK